MSWSSLMSDVVSPGCRLKALTEDATFCQGLCMPILRFIGCLHPSYSVVFRTHTLLKDFFVSLGNSLRIYLGLFNGATPPFRGRKFLLLHEGFPYEGVGFAEHHMLRLFLTVRTCRFLAVVVLVRQFRQRFLCDGTTPVKSLAPTSGAGFVCSACSFQLGFSRSSGCSKPPSPLACQNDLSIGASAYVSFLSCPKGHHHCSTTFTR